MDKLYEQPGHGQETGIVVDLTPNVNGLLRRWGVFAETIGGVEVSGLAECAATGEEQRAVDLTGSNQMWQHPWELVQKDLLLKKLRDMATKNGSHHVPLTLHESTTVESVDPVTGRILLADSTSIEADVIVAADGIHVRLTLLKS